MTKFFDSLERFLLTAAARLGPWLAPVGPAYAIARACVRRLGWPETVAWAVGVSVEMVGIAAAAATLRAYGYNRDKNKSDPPAPTWLGITCLAAYLAVAVALAVLVEVVPTLVVWAPASLFVLAGVGYCVLAMEAGQTGREETVKAAKAQARADRDRAKAEKVRLEPVAVQPLPSPGPVFIPRWPDKSTFLADHDRTDHLTANDVAEMAGITDRTARRWLAAARSTNGHVK